MVCVACKQPAGSKYQCTCNYNVINEKEDPAPAQCKSCTCNCQAVATLLKTTWLCKRKYGNRFVLHLLFMNNRTAIAAEGYQRDPSKHPSNAPRENMLMSIGTNLVIAQFPVFNAHTTHREVIQRAHL